MSKGRLFIVSGPSGAGKGTVLAEVFKKLPNLKYSVSATTRDPRPGEQEGVNYFYVTHDEFERKINANEMLEYASYCDHYYGTPRDFVEKQRELGFDVVLEIEPCGAMQVMEKCKDAISVFILPPDIEELRRRLSGRGTEAEDVIEARIAKAIKEIEQKDRYDHAVVNDDLDRVVDEVISILR